MENLLETKVGAVVSKDYRTARVFSAYGIDFCCKGGISVAEACKRNEADAEKLKAEIEALLQQGTTSDEVVHRMSLTELAWHIVNTHHQYVRENGPLLEAYLLKIANVHGGRHPELINLYSHFRNGRQHLVHHMEKEEHILFPLIERIDKTSSARMSPAVRESLHGPIAMMEQEHDTEGERFREMRALTNDFNPPADACQTYRVAFKMLAEFEADLHRHIHLENNILFVKAIDKLAANH
ncbi:MAG: iron-sulfur cluster repair di-iron protein [Bacteroidia bacterium]